MPGRRSGRKNKSSFRKSVLNSVSAQKCSNTGVGVFGDTRNKAKRGKHFLTSSVERIKKKPAPFGTELKSCVYGGFRQKKKKTRISGFGQSQGCLEGGRGPKEKKKYWEKNYHRNNPRDHGESCIKRWSTNKTERREKVTTKRGARHQTKRKKPA